MTNYMFTDVSTLNQDDFMIYDMETGTAISGTNVVLIRTAQLTEEEIDALLESSADGSTVAQSAGFHLYTNNFKPISATARFHRDEAMNLRCNECEKPPSMAWCESVAQCDCEAAHWPQRN